MTKGENATIREVYDLIKPMNDSITRVETLLSTHLDNYSKNCTTNKEDHTNFNNRISGKISIKAFASWLSGAVVIISGILGYLKFLKIM